MIQKVKLVLACPLLVAAEWGYSPDAFGTPNPGEDAAFSSLTGVPMQAPAQPAQQPQQAPQQQPMMQGGMGGFGQPQPMMGQPMAGGFGAQAAPMAPMLGAFGAQPMYQQAPPPMMPQQMQPQFAAPMPSPNFGMPALDIPSGSGSLHFSGVSQPPSAPTTPTEDELDFKASILKASSDHASSGLLPGADKFSAPSNNPLSDAAFSAVGTVKLPEPAQPKEDPATTVVNADDAKNVVKRFRKLVSQNSNAVLTNSTDDLAVARGAVTNDTVSLEAAPNSNKQSFWPANRMESAFANFLTIALYFTIVFALVIFTERVAHSSYASRHLGNKCPHRNAKPGLSFQSLTRRTSPQYSNTFIV